VKAKDEAGNLSEATNEVAVTTSSKSAYSSSSGNYIIINSFKLDCSSRFYGCCDTMFYNE
jgi:hypothetical protein